MVYALDVAAPSAIDAIYLIFIHPVVTIIVLQVLLLLVAVAVVSVCVIKKNKARKNAAPPAEETNDA